MGELLDDWGTEVMGLLAIAAILATCSFLDNDEEKALGAERVGHDDRLLQSRLFAGLRYREIGNASGVITDVNGYESCSGRITREILSW